MRLHHLLLGILALGVLALGARPLAAQTADGAPRPHGVYANLGGAVGVHHTSCRVCEIGGIVGTVGTLTVGAALSPGLVLAGEGSGGYFHELYVEDAYFQAGPALIYYPSARGLWLKGGVGFTIIIMGEDDGGAVPGAAASASVGWDLPLGRAFAVTPSLTVRYAGGHDVHTTAVLAGVGVAVY
jgi:hypothetical protein